VKDILGAGDESYLNPGVTAIGSMGTKPGMTETCVSVMAGCAQIGCKEA